jgi:hypothetical protein
MGTITKTVQQPTEKFREKQMKLNNLTQLGRKDAADYFREHDKKSGTSESGFRQSLNRKWMMMLQHLH